MLFARYPYVLVFVIKFSLWIFQHSNEGDFMQISDDDADAQRTVCLLFVHIVCTEKYVTLFPLEWYIFMERKNTSSRCHILYVSIVKMCWGVKSSWSQSFYGTMESNNDWVYILQSLLCWRSSCGKRRFNVVSFITSIRHVGMYLGIWNCRTICHEWY